MKEAQAKLRAKLETRRAEPIRHHNQQLQQNQIQEELPKQHTVATDSNITPSQVAESNSSEAITGPDVQFKATESGDLAVDSSELHRAKERAAYGITPHTIRTMDYSAEQNTRSRESEDQSPVEGHLDGRSGFSSDIGLPESPGLPAELAATTQDITHMFESPLKLSAEETKETNSLQQETDGGSPLQDEEMYAPKAYDALNNPQHKNQTLHNNFTPWTSLLAPPVTIPLPVPDT